MTLEECQIYLILFYENTKRNANLCNREGSRNTGQLSKHLTIRQALLTRDGYRSRIIFASPPRNNVWRCKLAQLDELLDVMQKTVGQEQGPFTCEVDKAMMIKIPWAVGDPNPLWRDECYASGGVPTPCCYDFGRTFYSRSDIVGFYTFCSFNQETLEVWQLRTQVTPA